MVPKQAEDFLRAHSAAASVPTPPLSMVHASATALEPDQETGSRQPDLDAALERPAGSESVAQPQSAAAAAESDHQWRESSPPSQSAGKLLQFSAGDIE